MQTLTCLCHVRNLDDTLNSYHHHHPLLHTPTKSSRSSVAAIRPFVCNSSDHPSCRCQDLRSWFFYTHPLPVFDLYSHVHRTSARYLPLRWAIGAVRPAIPGSSSKHPWALAAHLWPSGHVPRRLPAVFRAQFNQIIARPETYLTRKISARTEAEKRDLRMAYCS